MPQTQATATPGARLARRMANDLFWSEDQQRAFELACCLAGVPVTKGGAASWKRQRGVAFP